MSCQGGGNFRGQHIDCHVSPFLKGAIYRAAGGELRAPEASSSSRRRRSGRPTVTGSQIGPPAHHHPF